MAKHRGKKYLEIAKLVDREKLYTITDAVELVAKTKTAKFVETVEVAWRLGVDPRHADQQVRGTVVLPHGTGKTVKVLAITQGENINKALEAGAEDFITEEDCFVVLTDIESFLLVKDALSGHGYSFVTADIEMIPQTYTAISDEQKKSMDKMMDMLEEDDDVQNVYHNLED